MSTSYTDTTYFRFDSTPLTYMVRKLIWLNVCIFAAQLLIHIPFGGSGNVAIIGGGVVSLFSFNFSDFIRGLFWQPITYQFLHGGLMHLFSNMLWLYFFGPEVERMIGSKPFLYFYAISGAIAVLLTFFIGNYVIGASGSVMAVLMAYAVINPERPVFMFPIPIPISARFLVIAVIVMNLISSPTGTTFVHFGGLAAGYLYMRFVLGWDWHGPTTARFNIKMDKMSPPNQDEENIYNFDDYKNKRN